MPFWIGTICTSEGLWGGHGGLKDKKKIKKYFFQVERIQSPKNAILCAKTARAHVAVHYASVTKNLPKIWALPSGIGSRFIYGIIDHFLKDPKTEILREILSDGYYHRFRVNLSSKK